MQTSPFPTIPRLESLHHRLKTARGSDGEPLPLLDELMILLEDPPTGVSDRWQAGAELCAAHGITTSRVAVWQFYRGHVLPWRRENAPALGTGKGKVSEESIARLLEQARHLAALRVVESLQHPHLPPCILVGVMQNENRRQELLLAREKFADHLDTKQLLLQQQRIERIHKEAEDEARARNRSEMNQQLIKRIMAMSPERKDRAVCPLPVQAHSGS